MLKSARAIGGLVLAKLKRVGRAIVDFLMVLAVISGLSFTAGIALLWYHGLFAIPELTPTDDHKEISIIYDDEGKVLAEFCLRYCRESMPLAEMRDISKYFIAAEDKRFFAWWRKITPLDIRTGYALLRNILLGKTESGASTIEMQLSRTLYLRKERAEENAALRALHLNPTTRNALEYQKKKWWRKFREIVIAAALRRHYRDFEILEKYLNNIYLGDNFYGVKAASRWYFKKHPAELDAAEMAMLVGRARKPSAAGEEAISLRSRVLGQFTRAGLITEEERRIYDNHPLPERIRRENIAGHFVEYIRREITKNGRLVDEGLRITSTLNLDLQRLAARSLEKSVEEMRRLNPELTDLRGGALLVDVRNGDVKIWAGYPKFSEYQYDTVTQAARHTGSTFKIVGITAWITKGGRVSCADEGGGPCQWHDSSGLSLGMGGGRRHYLKNFPYQGKMERYLGIAEPLICFAESRNACFMSAVEGVAGSGASSFGMREMIYLDDECYRRLRSGDDPEKCKRTVMLPERLSIEEILKTALLLRIPLPVMDYEEGRRRAMLIPQDMAERLGVPKNTHHPGHTVMIGSIDVTLWSMTRMMLAFADGIAEPGTIQSIKDKYGKSREVKREKPEKVLDERVRLQMVRVLRSAVEFDHGTAKALIRGERIWQEDKNLVRAYREKNILWRVKPLRPEAKGAIGAKTGTATDGRGETTDLWFLALRYPYVCGGWIGREQKLPMKTVVANGEKIQFTGGKFVLPVCAEIFHALEDRGIPYYPFPENTDPAKPFRFSLPTDATAIEVKK